MTREVALVLSGGGARGMAHIGAIRELLSQGYSVHSVAGCSIGSVVAAFLAMGKLEEFASFMLRDGGNAIMEQLDFTLSDHGFIKGDKLIEALQEFAPDCNIEDLPMRLTIVATDLTTGQEVVYRKGSVYKAIRASVAIPAVITAVQDRDRWLVDGGVVNPLPMNCIQRKDGDLLVAVSLYGAPLVYPAKMEQYASVKQEPEEDQSFMERLKSGVRDVFEWRERLMNMVFEDPSREYGIMATMRLMGEISAKRLTEQSLQLHPADLLVEIPIASCGLFAFSRGEEMIRMGRTRMKKKLDALMVEKALSSAVSEVSESQSGILKKTYSGIKALLRI